MARPRSKTKKILFAVEIIVLLLFIGGLYVYGQFNSKMDNLKQNSLDSSKIQVNQEVQDSIDSQTSSLTGYKTYALFGIDHRDKNAALGGMNSDTMIIAGVNNDTKDVKLVSVYRDTILNVYDDTYSKANSAYAKGPEEAISMLNRNLDLNIQDYATVNFSALTALVDAVGGLELDLSYAEIVHMNSYCEETANETGQPYVPAELPERPDDIEELAYHYHLNGVQVTSYCRIRYTASLDMGRTERQRKVIQLIVQKAKKQGLTSVFNIMDQVFPMIETSLDKNTILQLLPTMIGYSLNDTTGFPTSYKFSKVKGGDVIVPTTAGTSDVDLVSNVKEIHKFLYGEENYTPSSTVQEISNKITEIVSGLGELSDTQTATEETENTAGDTVIFENDGSGWTDNSGSTDDGSSDWTDNSGSTDDGGSDWTDPGTGDGSTDDGGSDWTDPGTGDGSTDDGGGDWTDPGTGDGSTGDGGGDWTDPGTGDGSTGDVSGGGDDGTGDAGGDSGIVDGGTGEEVIG